MVEVRRRRPLEPHLGASAWVSQMQTPRVKHRPVGLLFPPAVLAVARDRMTQRRKVNTDLVRASGVEVTAQKGMGSLPFEDLVSRPRKPSAGDHRHALALGWMPADRTLQLTRVVFEAASDDGQVGPAQRAILQLRREIAVSDVRSEEHTSELQSR